MQQYYAFVSNIVIKKGLTVVCGHYGCGKTNLCINLALECARSGQNVTLIDLDIVNPYFRSTDYSDILTNEGVMVIGPTFANTNLDTPSLPAAIGTAISDDGYVIIDVGGDDAGATALARYSKEVGERNYEMIYVINKYRSMTTTPEETAEILFEIENTCHLKATSIVNNSHLKQLTTERTIMDSLEYANKTADILGLPILCTTAPKSVADSLNNISNVHPVDVFVKTPWEKE